MWRSKNEKMKMKVYTKMKKKTEKSHVHVLQQIFNLQSEVAQIINKLVDFNKVIAGKKIFEISSQRNTQSFTQTI